MDSIRWLLVAFPSNISLYPSHQQRLVKKAVDRVSFNCWRSIWGSPEWSSWFAWCTQSPSVLCQSFKWLTMVISLDIVRRVRLFYSCLSIVFYSTLLHYHYRDTTSDAFYPQLACCHDVLPRLTFFHRILQFIQTTHGLRHWVCRNRSDAKIFCWRKGKQEQLTVEEGRDAVIRDK